MAPVYVSRSTNDALGLTVLGKHVFVVRDGSKIFTQRESSRAGNWTIAFGEIDKGRLTIQDGFSDQGRFSAPNDSYSNLCTIRWSTSDDTWLPLPPRKAVEVQHVWKDFALFIQDIMLRAGRKNYDASNHSYDASNHSYDASYDASNHSYDASDSYVSSDS
jgi:hypothetical protein